MTRMHNHPRVARSRRSRVVCLVVCLLVLVVSQPVTATHNLAAYSRFCDRRGTLRGISAVADGPTSQIEVHTEIFEPAYAKACPPGSGLLTFLGSGERAGIEAILSHFAERRFGTTNVPLSTVELLQAVQDLYAPDRRNRSSPLHHIPLFVDIVAVGYNLSRCPGPQLKIRGQVLSLIYSGRISHWNHDLLVLDNPWLKGCRFPIRLVKRADFAGSTLALKDYMSKRDPQWNYYKSPARNQLWPSFANVCPALGEDGMAECIKSTQHSIGYIQYREARARRIRIALIDRTVTASTQSTFAAPSPAACTEAASSAFVPPPVAPVSLQPADARETPWLSPTVGDWSTVSITDAPTGYPICTFGYALMYNFLRAAYPDQSYPFGAARTSVDYLWTAVSDRAQVRLPAMGYGRLPDKAVKVSRAGLEMILA